MPGSNPRGRLVRHHFDEFDDERRWLRPPPRHRRRLLLGDNQYGSGTLAEYRTLYGPTWGRFKARTRPVPGNHEYEIPRAAGYFAYFGRLARPKGRSYYSFDLGGWHLVALNSSIDHGPGSAQERWLRADLVATAKRCILAYWHFPRFSSGAHQGN
jgi:hypothetical protein